MSESAVFRSPWRDVDPRTLHDLVQLRVDVFVVEQNCPYRELDGRDVEPETEHLWTADSAGPTAYLRILSESDGSARVGRVCTRAEARGQGLAARLMDAVLERAGDRVIVLAAQEYLTGWYGRFGFTATGAPYLEDDIPHVPMRREPSANAQAGLPAER